MNSKAEECAWKLIGLLSHLQEISAEVQKASIDLGHAIINDDADRIKRQQEKLRVQRLP